MQVLLETIVHKFGDDLAIFLIVDAVAYVSDSHNLPKNNTRSQAATRIADRTASQ